MAEELGAGYISLLPSMRGFSKAVKAELKKALASVRGQGVEIPVTPKFDQKLLDESLKANRKPLTVPVVLEPLNDKVRGDAGKVRVPVEVDRESWRRSLAGLGGDTRTTIHQRVDIDMDKDFVRGQLADTAKSGGSTLAGMFGNSFGVSLPTLIVGAIVTALASPFLAMATGAAVVAGASLGAVFFGAFLLRGDKDLQAGVKGLFDEVNKTLTKAAQPLKQPFLESIGIIKGAFKDVAPDIDTFFKDIAKSGGIQELARGIGGFIKSFSETGALKKLGQAVGPVLKQIGMALPDIGNAFSQVIITVTKPEFIAFVGKLLRGFADLIRFVGSAIGFVASFASTVKTMGEDIIRGFGVIFGIFRLAPDALEVLKQAVLLAARWIGEKWREIWDGIKSKLSSTVTSVTSTVKGIPDKIKTALGNAGTMLLNAGKAVVQGLIDGIKSKFTALGTIMSNVGGIIYNHLQHSPAKEGPLAGRGNTYYSGQAIASGLVDGVKSQMPTVASAASQLAGQFGMSGPRAVSAPAAEQQTVAVPGDRMTQVLFELIREGVRARNGNVQVVLGS